MKTSLRLTWCLCIVLLSLALIRPQSLKASQSYSVDSVPFALYSTAGSQTVLLIDDIWSSPIAIGFPFTFYGHAYSSLVVSSNGQICFDTIRRGTFDPWNLQSIAPRLDTASMYTSINVLYRDINVACRGKISYGVYGTAPNRSLVVTWDSIPPYTSHCDTAGCGQLYSTFQGILHEGCSDIEVQVLSSLSCPTWNSGLGVMGVVDSAGHRMVAPPHRSIGSWTAQQEGWRYQYTIGVCAPFTAGGDQSVCQSAGYTMQGGGTGVWRLLSSSPGTVILSDTTDPQMVVSAFSAPGSYRFIWVGASATDTVVLTVLPGLWADAGRDTSLCQPVTSVLLGGSPTAIGGTGPYSYLWTSSDFTFVSGSPNPAATLTGSVDRRYYLRVKDNTTQCMAYDTVHITVDTTSQYLQIDPFDTIILPGQAVQAVAHAQPPGGIYLWSPLSDILPPSGLSDTVILSPGSTRQYCFTYSYRACHRASCQTIYVQPVLAGSDVSVCLDDTVHLHAAGAGTWSTLPANPYLVAIDTPASPRAIVSGLHSAGTYGLRWTTAQGADTVWITVWPRPTIVLDTIIQSSCGILDGSITVHATGGQQPYQYSWDAGVTTSLPNRAINLGYGPYCVQAADQHSCTVRACFAASAAPPLSVTDSIHHLLCNIDTIGSICLQVSGGVPPYHYHWSTSDTSTCISRKSTGNYTVTVSDSRYCASIIAASILQRDEPMSLLPEVQSMPQCYGDSTGAVRVHPDHGGLPPFRYHWSFTSDSSYLQQGVPGGTYTVTAVDFYGCTAMAQVDIKQPDSITLLGNTVTDATTPVSHDGKIDLYVTGGTAPYYYAWVNPNFPDLPNMTGLDPGIYCLNIIDAHQCRTRLYCDTVGSGPNGITGYIAEPIQLYPNPANDAVMITAGEPITSVQIQDALGREVMATTAQADRVNLNIAWLPAGTYLVHIQTLSAPYVRKMIVD